VCLLRGTVWVFKYSSGSSQSLKFYHKVGRQQYFSRLDIGAVLLLQWSGLLGYTCALLRDSRPNCVIGDSRHTGDWPVCLSGTPEPNVSLSERCGSQVYIEHYQTPQKFALH